MLGFRRGLGKEVRFFLRSSIYFIDCYIAIELFFVVIGNAEGEFVFCIFLASLSGGRYFYFCNRSGIEVVRSFGWVLILGVAGRAGRVL